MKTLAGIAVAAASFIAAVAPAAAQTTTRPALTLDGARQVIRTAMTEAHARHAPGAVIAVVDEGGNLVALERLDDTFAAGANISIGKARTAALFKRPTRAFEEIIRNGRTPMIALSDFTPLQGGIPLQVAGTIVGGVGVSGAASAEQDEQLAIAGANALSAGGPPTDGSTGTSGSMAAGAVSYFSRDQVRASFDKGAVLFDRSDKYMVHTSRRDAPGLAEVHVKDADIIYVQEGQATFVTGGTVVEPKTTAPDELRGREISGGEVRTIRQGDVIIVPAGTPHWFKDVRGPFTYYVVKAR